MIIKRHKIKRVKIDYISGYKHAVEVEAEIYEYKGLQFGIYWENQQQGKAIIAIELQTGYSVGTISCRGSKSPKKDLLQAIAYFVDKANYESAISRIRESIEQERMALNEQICKLEQERDCLVFPINERIEL